MIKKVPIFRNEMNYDKYMTNKLGTGSIPAGSWELATAGDRIRKTGYITGQRSVKQEPATREEMMSGVENGFA
jgi:hypothetical protein